MTSGMLLFLIVVICLPLLLRLFGALLVLGLIAIIVGMFF